MADGYYPFEYDNGVKSIRVWTRDNQEFEIVITDLLTWESQSISLRGLDLARSILSAVWSEEN